jgi:hypothetical protein
MDIGLYTQPTKFIDYIKNYDFEVKNGKSWI